MHEGTLRFRLALNICVAFVSESLWSRYFQIAELEETIDTDLTRLYPEHGQFFQSPVCQAMLRRILLVWSLMNTTYSYRQGISTSKWNHIN